MIGGVPDVVISGILSGGIVAAVATLWTARSNAHKTNADIDALQAKLPVEVDAISVQGAEAAVLTMKAALDSARAHIVQLEADREADRRRIGQLEQRVDELQERVKAASRALRIAHTESESIRSELAVLLADQTTRRRKRNPPTIPPTPTQEAPK